MNCFQPASIDELAGKSGTFGAVGAPDNPARGLISTQAAHCDDGDALPAANFPNYPPPKLANALDLCRQWMVQGIADAVAGAAAMLDANGNIDDSQMPTIISCTFTGKKGRAKCNVLEDFGATLHAAQDFYSHTNWTDVAAAGPVAPDNPPGLGQMGPAPWLDLSNPPAPLPAGLISGCFVLIPESLYCNDGGGGPRVKHEWLNKDKGTIDPAIGAGTTVRGAVNNNFQHAVQAAIADTIDKWTNLQDELIAAYGQANGTRMICALTDDNPAANC
ncbi:MAG TPA: hypothetical protein VFN28_13160 [Amaricoccus sp.]|nr:hypothetical protein [Amaricoccus sp.]